MKHVVKRPKFERDTLLAFFSDTHGGIHDDPACRVAAEVCEAAGVESIYLVGDGLDCGVSSRHPDKQKKSAIDWGTQWKERESFDWFFKWMATRPGSIYMLGNHEAWLANAIQNDPKFCHMDFAEVMRMPAGIEVLPQYSRIRIGTLVMEHGDAIFPKSSGGKYPANRLLELFPDQDTIIGHLHHADSAFRTHYGEDDIPRFRRAEVNGHLSLIDAHLDYAGRQPGVNGWQQRWIFVRIWHYGGKPRHTITPVDVWRDSKNRPVVEWEGKIYHP